ncbi:hypothetical protein [Geobacillus subterraneus]|uniref:Uncharacterized protein n=2 Tax=Geobacillus TaxID=129337 RepID=A0A679FR88_9BACL|nr:hypothetical protein [Geobacillus subterraneus]BBW98633.1 hypothetical protein GsuE55_34660 [Geobacillus subterraneus]
MIESIIVCEHTTDDFKPINKKSIFFPNDFSVKMPHWRGFSSPGGGQTIAHGSFP